MGFTLIEMLVVLAIVALIASLEFPVIERAFGRERFRTASVGVESRLHAARSAAILRGAATRFDAGDLPQGVALDLPRAGIVFYPDGSANGGQLALTEGARRFRLAVDGDTGRIARLP